MRNVKNLSLCVLVLALVSTAAVADTYHVNLGESIQDAINATVSGDEIEVSPGIYTESIEFLGKAIRLYSVGGPAVTTIDATELVSSVVTCDNGEGANTILEGFTITGGNVFSGSGGGMYNDRSSPTVTNCILWGDMGGEIVSSGGMPTVTYSDVQGGWSGAGNIDADPMFADADGRLWAASLCIDAGDNSAVPSGVTTDLDGNPRIQGLYVDMGAFEATPATPETMLAGLKAYIMEQVGLGTIEAEMEVSLLAKVNAAIAALNRGNANDAKVAMNDLKALINQVKAQTDKKIEAGVAAAIIVRANAIVAALGG